MTCAGSAGAPIVTTAFASGILAAAAITAAPPSECPIMIAGAPRVSRMWSAAPTRSPTFVEKFVLPNSPCECPSPVKSKRSTAMPQSARAAAIRRAAARSFEQVKQCANKA